MLTLNSNPNVLYKPKPGDLVFVRGNKLLSRSIRFVTGWKWSHIAIYIKHDMIIEADWAGVMISSLKRYGPNSGYEYEIVQTNLPADKRFLFINALFKRVGDGYDYGLFFGNLLYMIFGHTKKIIGWSDDPGRHICVELAAEAMIDAGVDFGKPANMIGIDFMYDWFNGSK